MPLLSMPASVSKGTALTVTLDKSALFALAAVSSDSFFSNMTNVKRVIIEYNSDPGNQRKYLIFDVSEESPSAIFETSIHSRSWFLLERVVLEDFDEGTLVIERPDLPVGYDVVTI